MKTKFSIVVLLLIFLPVVLPAAESQAFISYAEGKDFIVVSDGKSRSWTIGADEVIGIPLKEGDSILTGDSFVEIELTAGNGGVIKVAENTTFTLSSLDGRGGGVFKVVSGRIRVRTASLLEDSRIWITGNDTFAGVAGTDFGYDLLPASAGDSSAGISLVYVFDGEVDVLRFDRETISKTELMNVEPYILRAGRLVAVEPGTPIRELKDREIDPRIVAYWDAAPFRTKVPGYAAAPIEAPVDEPAEEPPAEATAAEPAAEPAAESAAEPVVVVQETPVVSENLRLDKVSQSEKEKMAFGGKLTFATGVGMMTTALLLRLGGSNLKDVSTGIFFVGSITAASGMGIMIYSYSLP